MKLYVLYLFLSIVAANELENFEILKAKTKFGYFNTTFTWTVEKFQLFDFGQNYAKRVLESPTLYAIDYSDGNQMYEVKIKIDPEFHYNNVIAQFELKTDFIDYKPKEKEFYFTVNNNITYTGNKMPKSYFNNALDDIEITVRAVFSKNITVNDVTSSLSPVLPYDDEPVPLGNELLKMYKTDSEFEFTIVCAGEEITAYKPVMKARSPVFKELLSNETNQLRITDFEPKIVKKMIEFSHNDTIEDFEGEETSVFSIAYKYKIKGLMVSFFHIYNPGKYQNFKSYASKKIADNATTENAITRFKFAHFYGYEKLKKWYFKYIIENFTEVAKTKAFKLLDDELYKPILQELINQNKIS